jgi:hypothetical protein
MMHLHSCSHKPRRYERLKRLESTIIMRSENGEYSLSIGATLRPWN